MRYKNDFLNIYSYFSYVNGHLYCFFYYYYAAHYTWKMLQYYKFNIKNISIDFQVRMLDLYGCGVERNVCTRFYVISLTSKGR